MLQAAGAPAGGDAVLAAGAAERPHNWGSGVRARICTLAHQPQRSPASELAAGRGWGGGAAFFGAAALLLTALLR